MKKLLAMTLAAAMTLSLTACTNDAPSSSGGDSSTGGDATASYKIAIITGTVSQGEEEFRQAEKMRDASGGKIITATYPDNFAKEQETTISNTVNLVSDPDVKGLVFLQAVPGAAAAIAKAKEINPDLIVVAGVIQEDPAVISAQADIILNADEVGMGTAIPRQAAAMGAKTFVQYSFPRHLSIQMIAERTRIMQEECEKLNITFISESAPDPLGDSGVSGAQQFILEDVPKKIAQYGKDTAFFATNCAMQEPLIKTISEGGAIMPQQCCPSPYHGYPGAFAIEIPEDKAGDVSYILEATSAKIDELGNSGRMSTWPVPVNMLFVEAGVKYIEGRLDGTITGTSDMADLTKICADIAGTEVQMGNYTESGTTYDNIFTLLSGYYTFGGLATDGADAPTDGADDASSSEAAPDEGGESTPAA